MSKRACPDCQAPVQETANFCDNCGRALNGASSAGGAAAGSASMPPSSQPAGGADPGALNEANPPDLKQTGVLHSQPEPDIPKFIPSICGACGFINLPGELFCQSCGVQLAPVASQPPPLPRPVSGSLPRSAPVPDQPAPSGPVPGVVKGKLLLRETRRAIPLPASREVILGRSDPVKGVFPDIDLALHGGESSGVSRRHARLTNKNGILVIEDLNSTNFTFLNRQKLLPGQSYPVKPGDEIRLGLLILEYRPD